MIVGVLVMRNVVLVYALITALHVPQSNATARAMLDQVSKFRCLVVLYSLFILSYIRCFSFAFVAWLFVFGSWKIRKD